MDELCFTSGAAVKERNTNVFCKGKHRNTLKGKHVEPVKTILCLDPFCLFLNVFSQEFSCFSLQNEGVSIAKICFSLQNTGVSIMQSIFPLQNAWISFLKKTRFLQNVCDQSFVANLET